MAENVLDDALREELKLVPASKEKRLANFFIDYLGVIILVSLFYLFLDGLGYSINPSEDIIQQRMQGMIFYVTYYLLIEGLTDGQSLGKIATKTKVVTIHGEHPEVMDILARSFLRLIPFEPFSFLGQQPSGWHDRWSKTMVIDEQLSVFP